MLVGVVWIDTPPTGVVFSTLTYSIIEDSGFISYVEARGSGESFTSDIVPVGAGVVMGVTVVVRGVVVDGIIVPGGLVVV